MPILILNLGHTSIALVVDQLVEAKEIVVKSMGSLLKRVSGVFGATLTGDGSVVIIVNPNELIKETSTNRQLQLKNLEKQLSISVRKTTKLNILIVDDSITLRRTVSDLIKRMGWNPIEAKDGLDALEILQTLTVKPDVIVLDIEMPRMDGYELSSALRSDESYQHTPIIMLTSRSEEKHRKKAFESGATEYLVKPYQEDVLIDLIRKLSHKSS
jgi:chemosensory pili system protein ChpA (sensor histidine kinase/response regulator)